jgi:hypothetical protein
MADNPRYGAKRGDGAQPRGGARASSDPLEELARLIGRDDPFADLRREHPQASPRPEPPAPTREEPAVQDWGRQRSGPRHDVADDAIEPRNDQPDAQWRAGRYRDQAAPSAAPSSAPYAEPQRFSDNTADPRYAYDRAPQYEEESYDTSYDGALPVARDYDTDEDYADEQAVDVDDGYEAPEERSGGSRRTLFGVVGIIVLLVGGAFGYRALTTSRDASQTPVIVADRSPSKIVPAGQTADGQPNKLIYDRVADKPQDTGDLVSREERPVDVRTATPRSVFPGAGATGASAGPNQPALGTPGPAPAPPAPAAAGPNEPKRVKTLTIKPDQLGAADTPDAGSAWPAAPTTRSAASAPPAAPVSVRAPQREANAAPEADAAAAPPRAARTAPAREGGGYLVQLFSGKSENESHEQFRTLQGKYHDLLANRQPIIRRADLGEKGVFYRAMVGPFATNELASQFCENLKNAGGKCIVQRN